MNDGTVPPDRADKGKAGNGYASRVWKGEVKRDFYAPSTLMGHFISIPQAVLYPKGGFLFCQQNR